MPFYQKTPRLLQKIFPNFEWKGNQNAIHLTFDDGPHPEITTWVLNQLDIYQFKATFFCVGQNAELYPEITQEILKRGHQIGNHTMHHLKGWKNPFNTYLDDVEACHAIIPSKLFRPPYGRITLKQAKALKSKYRIIMWTLLSCDYLKDLDCDESLSNLKKHTKNGSIIVFHDSLKAEKNLKVLLPQYLQFVNNQGLNCALL